MLDWLIATNGDTLLKSQAARAIWPVSGRIKSTRAISPPDTPPSAPNPTAPGILADPETKAGWRRTMTNTAILIGLPEKV